MSEQLQNVKAVGFDLDGTLYPATSEIDDRVRMQIALRILEKKPELENVESARSFFEQRYAKFGGGKKVLMEVGYEDPPTIMEDCLARANVLDLINPNKELGAMMKRISLKYESYLLTSSPYDLSLSKLEKIGIDPSLFNNIICRDNPKSGSKISGEAFDYVLSLSQFPACQHVYIGNRKKSDILPARERGMKTIAIGSNIREANLYLNSINELEKLFLF